MFCLDVILPLEPDWAQPQKERHARNTRLGQLELLHCLGTFLEGRFAALYEVSFQCIAAIPVCVLDKRRGSNVGLGAM